MRPSRPSAKKEIALHAALAALEAVGAPKPVDDPHALAAECQRLDEVAWGLQEAASEAYEHAFRVARAVSAYAAA